jgi:glutamate-1-semialdehyde 2,1-aminomutase
VPLVTYLPNLAWVEEDEQQSYLEAFRELVLPQTEVLVGSHQTLADFLLPEWDGERPPSSREIAVAASKHGARYVLVTSVPLPDQFLDNVLANARARSPARSSSASRPPSSAPARRSRPASAALLATGVELHAAVGEALAFLDQALDAGFRPGWATSSPTASSGPCPRKARRKAPSRASPSRRGRSRRGAAQPAPCPLACPGAGATNAALFERARSVIPGGVNSPVRAFRAVGGTPRFIARAEGPYLFDARQALHRLHRLVGTDDPRPPPSAVEEAVHRAVDEGLSFGAPTEREIELAEEILRHVPSMEQLRLVSSGTEAAMSALRLARGATGRDMIVKFEGCYHGHADALLVKAGSGLATFGHPTSAGVPAAVVQHTLVLEYNNLAQLEQAFDLHGAKIACVDDRADRRQHELRARLAAVHAAPARALHAARRPARVRRGHDRLSRRPRRRAGALRPRPARLRARPERVRQGDRRRHAARAFGGKRDVMEQLAPLGPVYQAGTLSGNPVATACGLATLREIARPGFFEALAARTRSLVAGLLAAAEAAGVAMRGDSEGGMFGFFFADALPQKYAEVMATDSARFNRFFHAMLERGVYLAPALYEAGFVSAAHGEGEIAATLAAARESLRLAD